MDSVLGYFICRPSIPGPMYLINDSVSFIDDCDSCLAKTNVIDHRIEMQGQHGDLTVSLVDKLALLSCEDNIKENCVMHKVQENVLFSKVQTVQFYNFELWAKHEMGKVSVIQPVKERQSMEFTIEGPALQYTQELCHNQVIFKYDLSFIAKRKVDKYKVKYHKAKVKKALGGWAVPVKMPSMHKYKSGSTLYYDKILGKRKFAVIEHELQKLKHRRKIMTTAIGNNIHLDNLFHDGASIGYKVFFDYDSVSRFAHPPLKKVHHCKTCVVPKYDLQCKNCILCKSVPCQVNKTKLPNKKPRHHKCVLCQVLTKKFAEKKKSNLSYTEVFSITDCLLSLHI